MGPPGYFANSGELAIQMAVFFPVAYLIAVQLRPHVPRFMFWILALMPITAAMTILGASSRGGQLALVIQMILLFYRYIFRPKILIALVLAGAAIFLLLPPEQKQRFEAAGGDRTSLQRLNYWKGGVDMLNKHPTLGVGYFNFATYFERNYRDLMLYPRAQLPHNILVQVGADLGYAGLVARAMEFATQLPLHECFVHRFFDSRSVRVGCLLSVHVDPSGFGRLC
jgi:O-antigen ligase